MSAFAWFYQTRRGAGERSVVILVRAVALAAGVLLLACPAASAEGGDDAAAATSRDWTWPLTPYPAVVRAYDLPETAYGAGNRGVDLAGSVGEPVLAIGSGVVTYAGVLAGRGVVVVSHGAVRSTYEPVSATVAVGDTVGVGQPIGTLSAVGSHCVPDECLHLGVLRGADYVDPMSLLGNPPIRLKPTSDDSAVSASPPTSTARDRGVDAASYGWSPIR